MEKEVDMVDMVVREVEEAALVVLEEAVREGGQEVGF